MNCFRSNGISRYSLYILNSFISTLTLVHCVSFLSTQKQTYSMNQTNLIQIFKCYPKKVCCMENRFAQVFLMTCSACTHFSLATAHGRAVVGVRDAHRHVRTNRAHRRPLSGQPRDCPTAPGQLPTFQFFSDLQFCLFLTQHSFAETRATCVWVYM